MCPLFLCQLIARGVLAVSSSSLIPPPTLTHTHTHTEKKERKKKLAKQSILLRKCWLCSCHTRSAVISMDLNATDPTVKSTERCGDSLYQGFSKSLPYFDQYRDHDCLLWLLITFIRNKPKKLKRACHGLADREFLLHVYLILKNVCFYGVEKVMWFIAREKNEGLTLMDSSQFSCSRRHQKPTF